MPVTSQDMAYVKAWLELNPPALPYNSLVAVPPVASVVPALTLPSSPTDKQQAILVDSLTVPTYAWKFQWLASASRWLFIGGGPAALTAQGGGNATGTGWTSASCPGIAVAHAGIYNVRCGMTGYGSVNGQYISFSAPGVTVGSYLSQHQNAASNVDNCAFSVEGQPTLNAAGTIQVEVNNDSSPGLQYHNLWLVVTPVILI